MFAVAGASGSGFGGIAAATLLAGLAGIALVFALRRLRALLPDEVSGVVVMMIGVTLVGVATSKLGLHDAANLPVPAKLAVALGAVALIELKLSALEGGSLHLGSADGPLLTPAALPYALPADAA